ncbi:MAG: hypothetical protein AB1659_02095 [Thermodesulfobacteriota bacterium]
MPASLHLTNGSGQYSETLSIPLSVIRRAAELGFSKFTFERTWSSEVTNSATSSVSFTTALDSAASLEITGIRLYFENQQPKITVKRNQRLQAFADIRVIGRGVLNCYFEVDGNLFSRVVKHVDHAREQTLTIETPDATPLRTFDEGDHRVRLVVNQPRLDIDFPIAIFHVMTESRLSIILIDPDDHAKGDLSTVKFRWSRPRPDLLYRIEFASTSQGDPIFSAEVKNTEYSIPKPILMMKMTNGQDIYWRVKGFDKEGKPSGESEERRFIALKTDQQFLAKPGLKQIPPVAPKQPESQKSDKPLTPAQKMPPPAPPEYSASTISIKVTSPDASSILKPGSKFSIKWKGEGEMDTKVKVILYPEGQPHLADAGQATVITKSTTNNGMFDWDIPSLSRIGKYVIRVQTTDNVVKGDSAAFAIKESEPLQFTQLKAPTAPDIIIISPSNPGEYIPEEATYYIRWDWPNVNEFWGWRRCTISLMEGTGPWATGKPLLYEGSISNYGFVFDWWVEPGKYGKSGECYIGIECCAPSPGKPDVCFYGKSTHFYIHPKNPQDPPGAVNPKAFFPTPAKAAFKIKSIQYGSNMWGCPNPPNPDLSYCVTSVSVIVKADTDSQFKLGDGQWGHPDFGALAIKCLIGNPLVSENTQGPKYMYWKTIWDDTYSIKGGGGSKRLKYDASKIYQPGDELELRIDFNPALKVQGVNYGNAKDYPEITIDLFGYSAWGWKAETKDTKTTNIITNNLVDLPGGGTFTGN